MKISTDMGETWTAESALWRAICDAPSVSQSLALRVAYAIVRLHPELVAALEKLSAYKGYSNIRDLLARAHALGENK